MAKASGTRALFLVVSVALLGGVGCRWWPRPKVAAPCSGVVARTVAAVETPVAAVEPPPCADCVTVTPENFARAESDRYFATIAAGGGFGRFMHNRTPTPVDKQDVVRMNQDTLYSGGVFDLNAGSVTVTLPDAGKRYMSLEVINEDEYTPMVAYKPGGYLVNRELAETRYVMVAVRTFVDPSSAADLDAVHALQDEIKVRQAGEGTLELPKWDEASEDKVRSSLVELASTMYVFTNAFGPKGQVDPVMHLIGAATGWGGNPEKDARYVNLKVPNDDGNHVYRLTLGEVPVAGFWSVSVYDAKGYFEKNPYDAYTVNDVTAVKSQNGTVTVQFGGCDGKVPNCLPVMKGWNATVRLYRPQPEIFSGEWKMPGLKAVGG